MRFFAEHCPDRKFGQQSADQLQESFILIFLDRQTACVNLA